MCHTCSSPLNAPSAVWPKQQAMSKGQKDPDAELQLPHDDEDDEDILTGSNHALCCIKCLFLVLFYLGIFQSLGELSLGKSYLGWNCI